MDKPPMSRRALTAAAILSAALWFGIYLLILLFIG